MKTKTEILTLIEKAVTLDLEGIELLKRYDEDTIQREYNGIGPEYIPEKARARVTDFLSIFEAPSMIHDLDFKESDGTEASFEAANARFLRNCITAAEHEYPWYRPKRYAAKAAAFAMYDAVSSKFGWKAWRDAYEKNAECRMQNFQ